MRFFYFKQELQDFIVEEKLENYPEGKGHVFYVFFEKKNLNTLDVINYLCKKLKLKRKHFGIAGLKDKFGITRQWLSIYKRTIKSRGGEEKLLSILAEKVKILKYTYGTRLLKMGENKSNLFFIRLRLKEKIPNIELFLEKLKNGFPNFFGMQRFGKSYRNVKIGKKIFFGEKIIKDEFENQFKVQAFSSYLFNQYLEHRINIGYYDEYLEGDILYNIERKVYSNVNFKENNWIVTGPVYGYNLVTNPGTKAYKIEEEILLKNGLRIEDLIRFKNFGIYGIRRPLKAVFLDYRYKIEKDILLMFELLPGTYASSGIWRLDKIIGQIYN